jgi:uncharacterized protein (TIGR00106 family)
MHAAAAHPAMQPFTEKEFTVVLLEFSMSPFGKGESLSPFVARSLDIIDKSGLPYQLTPMGTIIEGEWDAVMQVVSDCFALMKTDCDRISAQIKVDYRAGDNSRMQAKIDAIEDKLGRKLAT